MTAQRFVLGERSGQLVSHAGVEHAAVVGITRSGKDVGVVIPSLYTCGGSVVVTDIKGEDWQETAGWRARRSYCLYFNPTDPRSHRHNPCFEVRKGLNEVRDMQNLVDMLVDPEGSNERRDHWEKTSHTALTGAGLHVLYAEHDKTLSGLANFLSDPRRSFYDTLDLMMRTQHLGHSPHPVVASVARELLNKSPQELSGVLSTAMSFLGLYRDPVMARATSTSDFMLEDLQNADHPVSLYLVIPPSDISRTRSFVRLFLNQMGRRLTEKFTTPPRHPLALFLNEFGAFGHMEFFESTMAYLAGYQIRCMLVMQSLHQFDRHYGRDNTLLDNCHVKAFYGTGDERSAERIKHFLDEATVQYTQQSLGGRRLAPWLSQMTQTTVRTGRPLLTTGEILQMDPTQAIVYLGGQQQQAMPPIVVEKIRYFDDPRFAACRLPPPDLQTSLLPPVRRSPWLKEGPKLVVPPPQRQPRSPQLVAGDRP